MKERNTRKDERERERETNLDGSNAESTGFKEEADTASGDSFSEPADHSAGYQHVFHLDFARFLSSDYLNHKRTNSNVDETIPP